MDIKLFEIPVYAMNRKEFDKRVEKTKLKLRKEYSGRGWSEKQTNQSITYQIYPDCIWEYNHIIGFIVVFLNNKDIYIKWHTRISHNSNMHRNKYYWKSHTKHFLEDTQLGGFHFSYTNTKDESILKEKLMNLVCGFAEDLKKREGYYADLEVFKNLIQLIDFQVMTKFYEQTTHLIEERN